jgi:hypothetical protein
MIMEHANDYIVGTGCVIFVVMTMVCFQKFKKFIANRKRLKLRSNNGCLEFFDTVAGLWLPVYGYDDMYGYQWFHILECSSLEKLEMYRLMWNTVGDVKKWMKEEKIKNNKS